MANINHEVIADPYIHEPKGVASALANKLYVSNGTGSGTWKKLSPSNLLGVTGEGTAGTFFSVNGTGEFVLLPAPHGGCDFFDATLAAPYTLAATTSYQKLAPTTTAGGNQVLFTEGTNARLTYTGTAPVAGRLDGLGRHNVGHEPDRLRSGPGAPDALWPHGRRGASGFFVYPGGYRARRSGFRYRLSPHAGRALSVHALRPEGRPHERAHQLCAP